MILSTLALELARKIQGWHDQRRVYESDLIKACKAVESGVDKDEIFDQASDFTSEYLCPDFYEGCKEGYYHLNSFSGCVYNDLNGCYLMDSVLDGSDNEDQTLDSLVGEYFIYVKSLDRLSDAIEQDLRAIADKMADELWANGRNVSYFAIFDFVANYIWLDDLLLYTQRDLNIDDLIDAMDRN